MKIIKNAISFSMVIIFALSMCNFSCVSASYKAPFEIKSKAAYMVNLDTGTVVYEKNANEKIYPASLAKIMTAILALENVSDLEGTVIEAPGYVFDELFRTGASTADILPYEKVRMIDLLYAMMLPSACEASSIIADYVGDGNITEFLEMMNNKAKEIGCKNTNFTNAHGLFNEEQVTTAYDMYLITKYALDLPMFKKISSAPSYQMPATNKHAKPYMITHTNTMLSKNGGSSYYKYMSGIKTGSLPEVGKNLVTTASKDGYNYLLVLLGAPAKDAEGKPLPNGTYSDSRALFDWAFDYFKLQTIVKENDVIAEVNVKLSGEQDSVQLLANKDVMALLPKDADASAIQQIKTITKDVTAPVKKGTILGKLDLKANNEIIATVELKSAVALSRSPILYGLDLVKRFLNNTIVKTLLIVLVLLLLIFIFMRARYLKIKRMQRARERKLHESGRR